MTGKELRAWRERLNIPQKFIVSALGVNECTIVSWERQTKRPNKEHIKEYARLLELCENNEILYPTRKPSGINHTHPDERMPLKSVRELHKIIPSLGMTYKEVEIAAGITPGRFSRCYRGDQYLTKSEYAAIKEYIKQKKLEKIFGGRKYERMKEAVQRMKESCGLS